MGTIPADWRLAPRCGAIAVFAAGIAGSAVAQSAGGLEPLILDTLVVEGGRIGRTLAETPAGTTIIPGSVADTAPNFEIRQVIDGLPNVVAEPGPGLPTIRGIDGSAGQIGAASFTTGAQPRVPVLVDGVPRPLAIGSQPMLVGTWDVEDIEVARGPQSTLGGRNALAGAVRVSTNDPVFYAEGAARLNFFDQDGAAAIALMGNAPLVEDRLAARVTLEGTNGETFIEVTDPAVADDRAEIEEENLRRARAKLLFTPAGAGGPAFVLSAEASRQQQLFSNAVNRSAGGHEITDFASLTSTGENEQEVYQLEGRHQVSNAWEVEGRVAYLDNRLHIPNTNPTFDLDQDTDTTIVEGLARYAGDGRIGRAVVGLSYERQQDDALNDVLFFFLTNNGDIENVGLWGEVELGLTERLTLIAGGRIEHDDRSRFVSLGDANGSRAVAETAFIPRLGLRYAVSDDLTVGYLYAEGYRPGGVDFDIFNPDFTIVEYDSEWLYEHEIYARGRFLDDRLALDASALYYTFEDAQVPGAGGPPGGGLFGNVPKARGYGLEVAGSYEIGSGLTANAGIGLLHTEIVDGGDNLAQFDGDPIPGAPPLTFNAGLRYAAASGFDASADLRHVAAQTQALGFEEETDAYTVVDLAAGYSWTVGTYALRIDAYVENALDADYAYERDADFDRDVVGRPRTVGIAATIRF